MMKNKAQIIDRRRIDSHKLIYHVDRVNRWLKGEDIYPIYIEVSLFGGCNHRCIYCGLDYLGYEPIALEEKTLKKFVTEAVKKGVKSIMYAGSGEPLLHKRAAEIIAFTKKKGIDVAVTSNGVMFSKDKAEKILAYLSWIKVGLDAGTPKTYSQIHRTKGEDFNNVLNNLKNAVGIRSKNRYSCTIGTQFLLMPQNYNEATVLSMRLRDIGVDYLIIKPYSQHPLSKNRLGKEIDYRKQLYLEEKLKKYSRNNFEIIFRRHTMEKIGTKKPYKSCFGLPFWTYLSENGDLYLCIRFLGDKRFVFGNIYRQSFKDIWESQRRKNIMKTIYSNWNINGCRRICRLDEINEYLWNLKNPPEHVNFI